MTIYTELEQGTDAWVAARCGVLTASQIGKLITPKLQVADNDTSRGLALTIAAERITGRVEYLHPTFDMIRGTEDEPVARSVYAENFAPVEEVGFITRELDGITVGFSPDGLVDSTGLIEIKSRKPKEHLKAIVVGQPPAENMAQMMTGLWVTGRSWCDYVAFSGGLPLWVHRIEPDPAWFAVIEAAARAFEITVADIIKRYTTATKGLPMTQRRPELTEITF